MKHTQIVAVVLLASLTAASQTTPNVTRAEQVQIIADALKGRSVKTDVLLNDLVELNGYVISVDDDWFTMSANRKKRDIMRICYSDVLAMSSKKGSVSFVPDPGTSPFGDWSDLRTIAPNTIIEITHRNGEIRSGRYRSSATDHLILAHTEKNDEWRLQRDEIAFVHRVRYGWRNTLGGIASGTQKGDKIGKDVGQVMSGIKGPISGSTGDGSGGLARPIGAGIGAMVGAAKGGGDKTDTLKIIVYSR